VARIRSIKPEFWTSQKLARVSRDARLVFVGLWNEADDDGRLVDAPKRLAGALFPFDEDTDARWVDARMAELAKVGVIVRYAADGDRFAHIPSFREHQHPDKPRKSSLPPPPDAAPRLLPDSSPTPPRLLPDESGGDMDRDRDRDREKDREREREAESGSAPAPEDRSRQSPDAPAPLPGRVLSDADVAAIRMGRPPQRLGFGGVGFMEDPAKFPQDADELLEQNRADLIKSFPMLDGRPPRPSLRDAVAAKWGAYVANRARNGGHANAYSALKTWLGEMAQKHRVSWEREHSTIVDNSAAVKATTTILRPLEGPHPSDDPAAAAEAAKALEAISRIGKATTKAGRVHPPRDKP
jgi:hypothetical protein